MANIFPKWSNTVPIKVIVAIVLIKTAVAIGYFHYFTPEYTRVGYQPVQPVAFDHSIHTDQIGLDCRYCHTFVDRSEHSTIPDAATCMNCHNQVQADSPALAPIREAVETGKPVEWVRVHKTPDYVFFNHSVHVNRGVSCVECHGQINKMETVEHAKSLSMAFCLDCHRNPERAIRPVDKVYDLDWKLPEDEQLEQGTKYVHKWNILPPTSCSGCHR